MDKKKMTKKGTHIVKRLLAVVCCAAMMLGLVPNGIGVETVQAESYSGSVDFIALKEDDILAAGTTINNISYNSSIFFRPNADRDNVSEELFSQDDGSSVSYQLPQKYEYNEGYIESTSWKIWYADIESKVIVLYPTPYEVSAISTGLTNATATLSKTSNVAYSDEVTLTVTAAENYTLSASSITVTPSGCEAGAAVASADNKTLTYTLTHFTADATVTVSGSATDPNAPQKGVDYDYTMAELKANGTTKLAAGTKIYLDKPIAHETRFGGTYEYGVGYGMLTDDRTKIKNYGTYVEQDGCIKDASDEVSAETIITLDNSYVFNYYNDDGESLEATITGKEWYFVAIEIGDDEYGFFIMPTSPTEGYIKEDTHTHTPVHHDEVAATTTSTGTKEYWSCSGCDKIFSDAACTQETTLEALIIAALENSVTIESGKLIVSAATTVPTIKTATVAATASDVNEMLTKSNNLTQEEITAIKGGKTAKIVLNVTDSTSSIGTDSKKAIDDKVEELAKTVSGLKVGQYLDIKLKKYIDNVEKADITDLKGSTVTVSMTLSGDLVNTDSTKTRTYYIIRLHDGQADKLDASFDAFTNTLSFKTGLFSDYAIAYAETAKPADSGNNGSNGSAAATSTVSASTTTTATSDETTAVDNGATDEAAAVSSPKTGEGRTVTWLAVILFAGAACIFAMKAYRKREI